jgi:hypothetical protein
VLSIPVVIDVEEPTPRAVVLAGALSVIPTNDPPPPPPPFAALTIRPNESTTIFAELYDPADTPELARPRVIVPDVTIGLPVDVS